MTPMIIDQILALLTDGGRPDAPEPTLLPWLAARITGPGLHAVARTAARVSPMAPREGGWPVIADAVAEVVAEREQDPEALTEMLETLPPVAAHLGLIRGGQIDWTRVRRDGRGYAALARIDVAGRASELADQPLWAEIFAAPEGTPVPHLADLRSVASFVVAEATGEPVLLTDEEEVYLLPFQTAKPADPGPIIRAVSAAARAEQHWYAAALTARVAPYIDESTRDALRIIAARMPEGWSTQVLDLLARPPHRWTSDVEELTSSHPAIRRLDQLAARVAPPDLSQVSLEVSERIASLHGITDRWEPAEALWDIAPGVDQAYEMRQDPQQLLGRRDKPVRFVNVYVAAVGQDLPVPAASLEPDLDYAVRCNIGPHDIRSLLTDSSGRFPDEFLPDGPLRLDAVLFVHGKQYATAPIDLPNEGASNWIELPLPQPGTTPVLKAELAIYYQVAAVVLYSLTIPFAGVSQGPQIEVRYQLSRSFADLPKIGGRSLSFIDPGSSNALYVNGLSSAAKAFKYNPEAVKKAAFLVRTALYDAHFSVDSSRKEISRYRLAKDRSYRKSASGFAHDLRELANMGGALYKDLFADSAMTALVRIEAEVRGRPPILQVASPEPQLLPIPWAAMYDLPVDSDTDSYELCDSIGQFGPDGSGTAPPARCPYEDQHRRGGGWKLNQLCPWGFWGLSTIIEHPPPVSERDLESTIRSAARQPQILMGYDTELDHQLLTTHLASLRSTHGKALIDPQVVKRLKLREALGTETMDIVYFYCHMVNDRKFPGQSIKVIELGTDQVTANDIGGWAQAYPPERHPLVVINGCRSVEAGPGSLFNFVEAFIKWQQASGVVGTEITIEQGLGGWAMELFLSALRTSPVGDALRSVRWTMFKNGNLMGLGYTPYCLAGLTLLAHVEE